MVHAVPVFVALLSAGAFAQDLDIDKTYDLAAHWIADSEPRKQAWAADLIASHQFETLYPGLLTALGDFVPNPSGKFEGTPEELALEVIACAIVRARVLVPAADARKLYPEFPALAMILLSRPLDDNKEALLSILHESRVGPVWLAAANILAMEPSPEFVIGQLDEFSVFARVVVFEPGTGGGIAGDCFSPPESSGHAQIPENWPPVPVYRLEVAKTDGTVMATGINAVSFVSRVYCRSSSLERRGLWRA
jgi:hypothetical protein